MTGAIIARGIKSMGIWWELIYIRDKDENWVKIMIMWVINIMKKEKKKSSF